MKLGITKLLFKSTSALLENFPPPDSMFGGDLKQIAQPEQRIVLNVKLCFFCRLKAWSPLFLKRL